MESFSFFTALGDDWKKIPQNFRYLILIGSFFIFNSWLLDNWGNNKLYLFFGKDIREYGYNFGLLLILIAFAFIISRQGDVLRKTVFYRFKYPINMLNETFYLFWFNGKLMLFDNKKMQYFHAYPWETAQNLLFVGQGEEIKENFENSKKAKLAVTGDSKVVDINKYKKGGSICIL